MSNIKSYNSLFDESIISEAFDMQSRSRHLIFLSESGDKLLVKTVLHIISLNLDWTKIFSWRQKFDKSRSLKVTLLVATNVFTVLKNKHKLRTSLIYGSIRIPADRTIMQWNQIRAILLKLKQRKATGESNPVMNFIKGMLTI